MESYLWNTFSTSKNMRLRLQVTMKFSKNMNTLYIMPHFNLITEAFYTSKDVSAFFVKVKLNFVLSHDLLNIPQKLMKRARVSCMNRSKFS